MTNTENTIDFIIEPLRRALKDQCDIHPTCWQNCPLRGHPRLCEFIDPRSHKYLCTVDLKDRKKEFTSRIANCLVGVEGHA